MKIITKAEIEKIIDHNQVIHLIEEGFKALAQDQAVIAPVASLSFTSPRGDCHIKSGYLKSGDFFVVKIATGFYDNPQIGLPSGNGMMIVFSKKTGEPLALLQEEGLLTELRTAAAGAVCAKYLAPSNVHCIGIVGAGEQAFYQLQYLRYIIPCRKVCLWGRNKDKALKLSQRKGLEAFNIEVADSIEELAAKCNLIVTTTAAQKFLLSEEMVLPGVHITAMGSDEYGKQELDPLLLKKADRLVVDSFKQCSQFGETVYALEKQLIDSSKAFELGQLLLNPSLRRQNDTEITVADLTGVAIQDIQIATAVFESL